jgi:hypothetical protein
MDTATFAFAGIIVLGAPVLLTRIKREKDADAKCQKAKLAEYRRIFAGWEDD